MADITSRYDGNVDDSGKTNWRGDQVNVPQGAQSIYETSSVQLADLGARKVVGDRVFRYAKSGGTIAAGDWVETPAVVVAATAFPVAATKGDKVVTLTAPGTWTANMKAEGYLYISAGTAAKIGHMYRIKSHAAISSAATGTVALYDPISMAITTGEEAKVVENIYKDVVLGTQAAGHTPVGFAPIPVVSGDYFWMTTYGPSCIMGSAGGTKGDMIVPSATGSVDTVDTTTNEEFPQIGVLLEAMTATDGSLAFITIAP